MHVATEDRVKHAIGYANQNAEYRKFALQQIRDRIALIASDKQSGGIDVKVCLDDEFLEGALSRAFRDSDGATITVVEDVFYSLAVERWHARLWTD